ncbi:MAG: sulfatase-like hydrolase/transferase, partial [Oscillospiraceae bacterium]
MKKIVKYPFVLSMSLGFLINICIELFARKVPLTLLNHMTDYPLFFLANWFCISLTLCSCLFVKRKYFALLIGSSLWLALGFLNGYVLTYRVSPLTAIDFLIVQFSWNFLGSYVNVVQLVLIVMSVAAAVVLLAWIYRKAPQSPRRWKLAAVQTLSLAGITAILLTTGVNRSEAYLSDMTDATEKYGYVNCFFRSVVERGIDEPKDYSEASMTEKVDVILEDAPLVPPVKPNVIMVQLESFFDVKLLKNMEFSEDPVPFFTALKENATHGKLAVPTVGAGTANSEFEIITGMNLEFFGTGEYPYKTILKSETCETAPFNFLEQGYHTFAVHSNNATFYDRNEVFPRLGFECFVSSEYMNGAKKNSQGWIQDQYLVPQIFKCLDSTTGEDYVYTITVQGHGVYPKEKLESPEIQVTKSNMDSEITNQVEYYVNQMKETDEFIGALTAAMQEREEPTVVVFYGDHMPSLGFDSSDLLFGDLFETEYVLWANYEMPKELQDLEAFQLSAYVAERLGMNTGLLTRHHQEHHGDKDYLDVLENLEYDMLYGDKISLGGREEYRPTPMKMGIDPIEISGVYETDRILVKGKNFTSASVVCVNGNRKTTNAVSPRTLTVAGETLKSGDQITV